MSLEFATLNPNCAQTRGLDSSFWKSQLPPMPAHQEPQTLGAGWQDPSEGGREERRRENVRGGRAGGAPHIYRVGSQITTQEDLMETATDRQTHRL